MDGRNVAWFAFGLALMLILLDQSPVIGGWFLLLVVLGLLVLHQPNEG